MNVARSFSAVRWTLADVRPPPESSRRARQVYSRSTSRLGFVRRCSASEVRSCLRPTQALPRLASSAGLRLENHELGRARRDAARLRRSGGHYDDDKHVIVTGRPALRPLVGLILDTLTCILQALLANRSMGASSLMAGATTSPTRACAQAPVLTLTSHASHRRPSLPPCGR